MTRWLIYEITAETTEPVQGSALYEGQTVKYSDATDARKVMVYVGQTSGGDDETDEQMLARRLSGHDGAAVSGIVAQPAWRNATKTIRAVKRCDTLADARRSESALVRWTMADTLDGLCVSVNRGSPDRLIAQHEPPPGGWPPMPCTFCGQHAPPMTWGGLMCSAHFGPWSRISNWMRSKYAERVSEQPWHEAVAERVESYGKPWWGDERHTHDDELIAPAPPIPVMIGWETLRIWDAHGRDLDALRLRPSRDSSEPLWGPLTYHQSIAEAVTAITSEHEPDMRSAAPDGL